MPLIVSKSDNSHVDVNGQPNNPFAYIWVLWEDGTIDAPGRGRLSATKSAPTCDLTTGFATTLLICCNSTATRVMPHTYQICYLT